MALSERNKFILGRDVMMIVVIDDVNDFDVWWWFEVKVIKCDATTVIVAQTTHQA